MVNHIKEKRQQLKITQQELAYRLKMSISQLANIENNRSITSVETGLKIAKELKSSVEELFELDKKE